MATRVNSVFLFPNTAILVVANVMMIDRRDLIVMVILGSIGGEYSERMVVITRSYLMLLRLILIGSIEVETHMEIVKRKVHRCLNG